MAKNFTGGYACSRFPVTRELLAMAGFTKILPDDAGIDTFRRLPASAKVAGTFPLHLHAMAEEKNRQAWTFERDHVPAQPEPTLEQLLARRPRLVRYRIETLNDAPPRRAFVRSYFHPEAIRAWVHEVEGIEVIGGASAPHNLPRTLLAPDTTGPVRIIGHLLARDAATICSHPRAEFFNVDIYEMPVKARGTHVFTAEELEAWMPRLQRYHVQVMEEYTPPEWQ